MSDLLRRALTQEIHDALEEHVVRFGSQERTDYDLRYSHDRFEIAVIAADAVNRFLDLRERMTS